MFKHVNSKGRSSRNNTSMETGEAGLTPATMQASGIMVIVRQNKKQSES